MPSAPLVKSRGMMKLVQVSRNRIRFMKFSGQKQKLLFLFLALIVSLIPLRGLAPTQAEMLSAAAQCAGSDMSDARELPACCRAAAQAATAAPKTCCCGHEPVKPVTDSRIVGGQTQLVKFVSIKGSGRLLPQLKQLAVADNFAPSPTDTGRPAIQAYSRPLYIIHRALLI